jgi:autotransporter family porin
VYPPPSAASISGGFTTLPPGAPLPGERECAARVHRNSWEPREDNAKANQNKPTKEQLAHLAPWNQSIGVDPKANNLLRQITGNFTGTTNEILQWVACKWGIDENIVRAEAVAETYWEQSFQGDYIKNKTYCPPGTWDGKGCYQSYGILQVKNYYFQGTFPMSRDDTAFSAEYALGVIRTCFEGWTTYLKDTPPLSGYQPYHAGDIWGCLGRWYSGSWYDQDSLDYITQIKSEYTNQTWLQANFQTLHIPTKIPTENP